MRGFGFVKNVPLLLFIDTEFTGLNQRWTRLISIGLVAEDGERTFCAGLSVQARPAS